MFPVLEKTTYLNTAGSGILSENLKDWRAEHDLTFLNEGSNFRLQQIEFLEGVKDTLASFFSAKKKFTYLVNNFSAGFHTLLNGFAKDHRFLLIENEFPAVYYPVQSKGFTNQIVAMGDNLEARILESIERFQPTIFSFSLVQYTNGVKLSFAFLRELKERFPNLLLVADGTQYCGTEVFNFGASPLDALLASGYKWMLGGYGNGFVLLKEEITKQIYTSPQDKMLPTENFLKSKDVLSMRFEPGHLDTLAFGSLQQSLLSLAQTGMPAVEQKIVSLKQQALEAFADRGLLDEFIPKRAQHSSIFRLYIDDQLVKEIQAANIICTARGKGLRVSFHYYNEVNDLERLLAVVDNKGSL